MTDMTHVFAGIKLGTLTTVAMVATGTIEDGHVSITVAITCCVFISGIVWWLSSQFQRISDRLDSIELSLRNCPTNKKDCLPETQKHQ